MTHAQDTHESGENPRKARKPLPRGIRVSDEGAHRKKRWHLTVGGKFRESFATEKEAIEAGEEVARLKVEHGKDAERVDMAEWRRYLEAKRLHFNGVEPEWASLAARVEKPASKLVSVAVADYLALRSTAGLSIGTTRQMKTKLRAFSDAVGVRELSSVTTGDLRAWVASLQAGGFAQWTVKDYLKVIATFFGYARREKWVAGDPTEAVELPRIVPEEIKILTVVEMVKLFAANVGQPGLGRLALEAFAGLRNSSAARLVYADLDFESKGVNLPASKHKSGRRHFIDGLPANLWRWLAIVPASDFDADHRQYDRQKHDSFVRAGITPPHNCLRHSFATYHVAANKDAAKTAVIMQHTSPAMLYRHYKGRATAKDGAAYFEIRPPENNPK